MKEKFNLSISNPCSEKFDQFQSTQSGGFCNSCQKEVIDFTEMSDREVLNYFKNREEKTCGRFQESQLKMYAETTSPRERRGFDFIGASLMSFSLLSIFPFANSQAQDHEPKIEVYSLKNYNVQKSRLNSSDPEGELTVKGIVVNEDGEPMPGVSILVKGTTTGIFADDEGKFTLIIPPKNGGFLIFSYIGYESQDYKIPQNSQSVINMKMEFKRCDLAIMGEVAIDQVYSSKPSFWQKVKGAFK